MKNVSKAGWMSTVYNNRQSLHALTRDCKILNKLHASTRDSSAVIDVLRVSDHGICQLCFVSAYFFLLCCL